MPIEREPRSDRAVVADLEVGELARSPLLGPVGGRGVHPLPYPLDRCAEQWGRGHRHLRFLPVGKTLLQVDEPSVDARDRRHRLRMAEGEFEHHVAAPRLAGDHRSVPPEPADQQEEVVGHGRHVVAVVRLRGSAVAALVDGDHRVAQPGEPSARRRPRVAHWMPARGRAATAAASGCPASRPEDPRHDPRQDPRQDPSGRSAT